MNDVEKGREVVKSWGYKVNYSAGGTQEDIEYAMDYITALEAVAEAGRTVVDSQCDFDDKDCPAVDCDFNPICQALSTLSALPTGVVEDNTLDAQGETNIAEGERNVTPLEYEKCPKCGEEMTWGSDGFYCESCGWFVGVHSVVDMGE